MRIKVTFSVYTTFDRHISNVTVNTCSQIFSEEYSFCGVNADHIFVKLVHDFSESVLFSRGFSDFVSEAERISYPRILRAVSRLPDYHDEFVDKSAVSERFVLSFRDFLEDSLVKICLFKNGDYLVSTSCGIVVDCTVLERDANV